MLTIKNLVSTLALTAALATPALALEYRKPQHESCRQWL